MGMEGSEEEPRSDHDFLLVSAGPVALKQCRPAFSSTPISLLLVSNWHNLSLISHHGLFSFLTQQNASNWDPRLDHSALEYSSYG